jgi:hypothetical protein
MQAGLQESVYFINLILSLYYMPNDLMDHDPLPIGIDTLNTKRILRRDSGNGSHSKYIELLKRFYIRMNSCTTA